MTCELVSRDAPGLGARGLPEGGGQLAESLDPTAAGEAGALLGAVGLLVWGWRAFMKALSLVM